jgi:hypothetical protein
MEQKLYHALLPENNDHYVPLEEILNNGISYLTKSNLRYGNGGKVKQDITNKLKPVDLPMWVDFDKAIGVDLNNRFSTSVCFPVFTDKILLFDGEISSLIYDQAFYDDNKYTFEEALDFDTGEDIEHWIDKYWKSMVSLGQYIENKPFEKPEVLIFESVPKEIIQVCK